MQIRKRFWIMFLSVLFMVPMSAQWFQLRAQTVSTTEFTATNGAVQILASGGTNPANSYNITGLVLTASGSGGTTAQLTTGTVNGNNCATGTAALSPNFGVSATNGVNNNPGWVLFGNPVFVVSGSAALCMTVTSGTVTGIVTYNR